MLSDVSTKDTKKELCVPNPSWIQKNFGEGTYDLSLILKLYEINKSIQSWLFHKHTFSRSFKWIFYLDEELLISFILVEHINMNAFIKESWSSIAG